MSNTIILKRNKNISKEKSATDIESKSVPNSAPALYEEYSAEAFPEPVESNLPSMNQLKHKFLESSKLVENIVLKKYLHNLDELEVIAMPEELRQISDIRLFKITEMVYQKDEYATYKFASVFSAVQNLNCGIFIIADSDGEKTEFYMGVRSLDDKRTTKSLKDTLKNALIGQFPGVKTEDLLDKDAVKFLEDIPYNNISAVSCIANNKDDDFKDNETFIQGLEKLALALQGKTYTAVVLAKSMSTGQLEEMRHSYETIYTQLSPFANMQISYGKNTALSISEALSQGITTGTSSSKSIGKSEGTSNTKGYTESESKSQASMTGNLVKGLGSVALGALSLAAAPLTGGASIAAAACLSAGQMALGAYTPATNSTGSSISTSTTTTETNTTTETEGSSRSTTDTQTKTSGKTSGTSENMQLTMQNKTLINTLERIDLQLKRLNECESIGMWECAAYFLSDNQETAEMAAGTYKAIMKGSKSGVETSATNYWGRRDREKLVALKDYITNFIHPVFAYQTEQGYLPVTASSLLSSNELAIQMGLPRKSVCGFPVIEHAEFGKEVVYYDKNKQNRKMHLGKIFSMGTETNTDVNLDINSLTMHTFVTGSTGSGKSNTVYEILNQLYKIHEIPFLVIEPAKGEYKNIFGHSSNVSVYGTNPKKTALLKINPFRFPDDVHVLEHLDRLVEIFNVCWPMYAAMPAILKDSIEKAYEKVGWNLITSENKNGKIYPNFMDIFEQIEVVINESKYSSDSKGDYSGALLTRVRSLTTGLNGLIFTNNDIPDDKLFDNSVIVDLSRVGSTETKSLIMGLLIMKLNEYRMSSGKINSSLSHITILEEAHNLLKRTSTEQSSESSNLLGKSVELLANSIAEMRTYGEGFIIADQSPGLLDMSVIRNTNTKIILRLPDQSDRELVGYAAGLNEEQIDELSKLKRGVAAVYQNDWVEPILVKVDKCELKERNYSFTGNGTELEINKIREQIVNMLIQGRLHEKLYYSVLDIEKGLESLALTNSNREFVEEQIREYKKYKHLELWSNNNFECLSTHVTDILGIRDKVESCVWNSSTDNDLTDKLMKIILEIYPDSSKGKILTLIQCLMKDMSTRKNGSELRRNLYSRWVKFIKKGGFRQWL